MQIMSMEQRQDVSQLKRNVTSTWSVWERAGPAVIGIVNLADRRIELSNKEAEYE